MPVRLKTSKGIVRVVVGDQSLTITQWSKKTGIPARTIRGRLERGWPSEDAVSVPANAGGVRCIHFEGQAKFQKDWAAHFDIPVSTLRYRLRHGRSFSEAIYHQRKTVGQNFLWTFDGCTMTVKEWAARNGLKLGTVMTRLHEGWQLDRALTTPTLRKGRAQGEGVVKSEGGARTGGVGSRDTEPKQDFFQ